MDNHGKFNSLLASSFIVFFFHDSVIVSKNVILFLNYNKNLNKEIKESELI